MAGYTKLHSSILHSTVWLEPHSVRIVWIAMMALADADGHVSASVPGLAHAARVTLEECEQALAAFLAPDTHSRTKADEGRRIEAVDGGWRLLNHARYRNERDPDERREQWRRSKQRARERDRLTEVDNVDIPQSPPRSAQAEAEAEAEAKAPERETPRARAERTPKPARPRAPELPLPADWKPTDAHRAYAQTHGIDVDLEADALRGWAEGRTAVSWNGTFSTRLANRARWNREGARNGAPVQRGGLDIERMKETPAWLDPGAAS